MDSSAHNRSILPLLLVALGCLAAAAPLIVSNARKAEFDASIEVFMAADERSKGSFEKLETIMSARIACLVLVRLDGIFSDQGAALVDEISEGLMALEGVPRVFSLTRAERPVRAKGFSFNLKELIGFEPFLPLEHRTHEEWREIEAFVTDYPWARDLLISKDGLWTMLVAEVDRDLSTHETRVHLQSQVEALVETFRERVQAVYVGSFPFIEAEVQNDIQLDVRRFFIVLPILLAAILWITFRSLQVLVCVLALECLGVGLLPVTFNLNGASINVFTGILFPLIAGLQLTFLAHFFAALRWAQKKGFELATALPVALRHVLRPSAIAAMTTAIGLLSLLTCDVGLVRDFGWLGAQSVLVCFGVTFLPAWLLSRFLLRGRTLSPEASLHAADRTERWMARLSPLMSMLGRHRRLALGLALAVVIAALPGLAGVRTDLRAIEFLSPESASRRSMTALDEHMGGMNLFELEIDCGRPGIQEPRSLLFLQSLERFAASIEGVTNVYGYAQIYAMLNQIWQRDAPGSRSVPTDPAAIAPIAMVVHNQDFLFGESIYDADRRRTTIFIRTRDMPARRYLSILEEIVAFAEANKPEGASVGGKTGLHSVLESDRKIVGSQIRSLLLCVAAVFTTLCILWRSVRLAMVAMLVNLPPLAVVLALHGYAKLPLNSVTVMVSSVVLGIAVDNGIHLLSFWSKERGRFDDASTALSWVLAHKLGPMACTTAVLVSGLSLFLWSNFPPLADFGTLSILALVTALISAVLILPPLLLTAFESRSPVPGRHAP